MRDDLGTPFARSSPARRVVSLVPSLTESVAATRADALVGATAWCSHPPDLDVERVRGTKNPNVAQIVELRPDVVLAAREENRRLDVQRLRDAGVEVWVTDIRTVEQAFASLRRMFTDGLGWPVPGWVADAEAAWAEPAAEDGRRVIVPVWRDPWMVVGSATFTGDVVRRLGFTHVFAAHEDRYPKLGLDELLAAGPELVLLPDEPYEFTADDGPDAFAGTPCALVDGRRLTWYGPSLIDARAQLLDRIARVVP